MRYLHERGICHRDLKLENWLFATSPDPSPPPPPPGPPPPPPPPPADEFEEPGDDDALDAELDGAPCDPPILLCDFGLSKARESAHAPHHPPPPPLSPRFTSARLSENDRALSLSKHFAGSARARA